MIFSLIYLFSGIICSAIAFYFFHKNSEKHITILLQKNKILQDENGGLLVKTGVLEEQVRTLQSDKEEFNLLKKTHQQLHIDFTNAQAQLVAANEKLENQKLELEGIGDRFKFEFKNLAQNILEEKN